MQKTLTSNASEMKPLTTRGEMNPTRPDTGVPAYMHKPETVRAIGVTLREAEILHWISHGKTNAEISAIFGISMNTVKTHLQRVYQKLGVENRVAAARFFMENG